MQCNAIIVPVFNITIRIETWLQLYNNYRTVLGLPVNIIFNLDFDSIKPRAVL